VTDGGRALSVDADLAVSVDGDDLSVSSHGDRLVVEAPSLRAGLRALRSTGGHADDVAGSLHRVGLTADVRVRGRTVALAGAAARPNALGRVVAEGIEVRAGGALAAALAGVTGD
jgi:hypothetical protein